MLTHSLCSANPSKHPCLPLLQAGVLAGADLSSTAAAVSSALAASKPADVDSRSGRVADIVTSFSTQARAGASRS